MIREYSADNFLSTCWRMFFLFPQCSVTEFVINAKKMKGSMDGYSHRLGDRKSGSCEELRPSQHTVVVLRKEESASGEKDDSGAQQSRLSFFALYGSCQN